MAGVGSTGTNTSILGSFQALKTQVTEAFKGLQATVDGLLNNFESKLNAADDSRSQGVALAKQNVSVNPITELCLHASNGRPTEHIANIRVDTALALVKPSVYTDSSGQLGVYGLGGIGHIFNTTFNGAFLASLSGALVEVAKQAATLEDRDSAQYIGSLVSQTLSSIDSVKKALEPCFNLIEVGDGMVPTIEIPNTITMKRSPAHEQAESNMQDVRTGLHGLLPLLIGSHSSENDAKCLGEMKQQLSTELSKFTEAATRLVGQTKS